MIERHVISVGRKTGKVQRLPRASLTDLGILERRDLQKWILEQPEVLGESLFVLSYEFGDFSQKKDRVDILALDEDGTPVVIELKRTEHGDYADLQALRYASKLKALTIEDAAKILAKSRDNLTEIEARNEISDFLGSEGKVGDEPRIILVSPGFSKDLTTTVLFLNGHDIDVSCVRLTAYESSPEDVILVPEVIIPLPEAKEFLAKVAIRDRTVRRERGPRKPESLPFLLERGLLKKGTPVLFKHALPRDIAYRVDDDRFHGEISVHPEAGPGILWMHDKKFYKLSPLTQQLMKELGGADHPYNGALYWGTEDKSLKRWTDEIYAEERLTDYGGDVR